MAGAARAAAHWRGKELTAAFGAWRDDAATRGTMRRIVLRMRHLTVANAFTTWRYARADVAANKDRLMRKVGVNAPEPDAAHLLWGKLTLKTWTQCLTLKQRILRHLQRGASAFPHDVVRNASCLARLPWRFSSLIHQEAAQSTAKLPQQSFGKEKRVSSSYFFSAWQHVTVLLWSLWGWLTALGDSSSTHDEAHYAPL